MKTVSITLLVALAFILPASVSGHGYMMNPNGSTADIGMMRTMEDRVIGNETHAEMEGLMEKMLVGNMTPADQDRLAVLMNQYPAGYSTMLNRMVQTGYYEDHDRVGGEFWHGMPYSGMMGAVMLIAMLIGGLFLLVWLIVGILAVIWLIRGVSKR